MVSFYSQSFLHLLQFFPYPKHIIFPSQISSKFSQIKNPSLHNFQDLKVPLLPSLVHRRTRRPSPNTPSHSSAVEEIVVSTWWPVYWIETFRTNE
ncbi:hypothetical protein ES319_D08G104900v1 [Gossypium barbadense]|uniref:Uncharacterized protein n=2 Tax=Gossypium TaxID=3633 RepID=A0A5J5QC60_GOSBA|nr:hypothetical protein ES319_D08G104900v1 [Gossypium barbadense]KAB2016578.1 hypothetical protein ES319_D08G104900v1 [Gossypium barbadense]TYG57030.1 hypothetical protein ES288_D08G111000v1 [Gossypium darwinii]TYG57031.1 hypothetical protein ES288_D08G111000v1 [Gossypium darwinii]